MLSVELSVIAYLSTINPPRPLFNASDLTLSTKQSLSLKFRRLLSSSTDLFILVVMYFTGKKAACQLQKTFFYFRDNTCA